MQLTCIFTKLLPDFNPCGRGGDVEDTHCFPACRMRQLKGYPDGSTSTAWDNAAPVSCVTSTGMPAQNTATIVKPLVTNLQSTPFTHGATCC